MELLLKFRIIIVLMTYQVLSAKLHRQKRLSTAEHPPSYFYRNIDGSPGTYSFGYEVPETDHRQYRTEERYGNGTVVGSYGYVDGTGRAHRYRYVADQRGYRVSKIRSQAVSLTSRQPTQFTSFTTEDSITWTRPKKKPSNPGDHREMVQSRNSLKYFYKSKKMPSKAFKLY